MTRPPKLPFPAYRWIWRTVAQLSPKAAQARREAAERLGRSRGSTPPDRWMLGALHVNESMTAAMRCPKARRSCT